MHQGMVMLCMTNVFINRHNMPERLSFLIHNALGIMVCLQLLPWYPMHATKKAVQTFVLYYDFEHEKECKA